MKRLCAVLLLFSFYSFLKAQQLPVWNESQNRWNEKDWLVAPVTNKAGVYGTPDKKEIVLDNGLIERRFRLYPNVACIDFKNKINNQQLLRAVKAEARITINGTDYNIGGLYGQKENAYLLSEWVDAFQKHDSDFIFVKYEVSELPPYLHPQTKMWASNSKAATGKLLTFHYQSGLPGLKGIIVLMHYELYDGLPLIVKWLSICNQSGQPVHLNRVVNEILGMAEEQSAVTGSADKMEKPSGLYLETNYAFNNAMRYSLSDQTTHWKTDSSYTSQVNYELQTPCLLEVYPEYGPGIDLQPNAIFTSVRTYELAMDSYDRQRRGMAIQKMYSTIAPWATANPIFMHLVSKNDNEVYNAIDQCAATGYEALILSFGSHINMEDVTGGNLERCKKLAGYAHKKGIKIGAYSLFSSRKISEEDDVINPQTGKTGGSFFGNAPCFGSKWGLAYRNKIKQFFTVTGFDIWENDGPYPGDRCASVKHPGHKGLEDSQWRQMELQKELYHWLNSRGIYINAPDWYFLDGTNKIALGYREVNFSLPRDQQKILNRQNIFDGTWDKLPSMGWGFVPLTRYQGGGPEAILEPLSEHLDDYEQLMMQYYGAGVQACYRGPRLYDTNTTKERVTAVISWYKKYRSVLNAPIIHLRRADGRYWDGWLHTDPLQKERGLLLLFNPTDRSLQLTIQLPLYYTGLTSTARVREKEGPLQTYRLNRNFEIELPVVLAPHAYSWWVIE
ncbi:alpha-galactosidase [Niabella ginsenosidivorans]|uniref:Alpha-galactosidase n=1 Tax=Niabella ginsenosidivorans TaxID=1176587 RepID=A0A1A9I3V3_9BACT|nr:alpha-galactosidase [Niabella ginsenosidivorans]ANH81254.1 alpha-galactosidase [Niabella ginsenosidivorans]